MTSNRKNKLPHMVNLNVSFKEAFFQRNCFIPYYNLLNTLFHQDKVRIILDAKTISVGIRSAHLHHIYGFSYSMIYECLTEIFSEPNSLRLSPLIDLSDYEGFRKSINDILSEYDTRKEQEALQIHVE
jgi:hypothetical protein